jgi:hypothetical protein
LGFAGIRRADQGQLPRSFTVDNERLTPAALLSLFGLLAEGGHLLF